MIRPAAIGFVLSALAVVGETTSAAWGEDATPAEVAQLVAKLASDDFDTREKAVPQLIAAGRPAVAAVEQAALTGESDTRFRAVTVLAAWSRGSDEGLSEAAQQSLHKVAAGDAAPAKQAAEALKFFNRLDVMRRLAAALVISTVEAGKAKAKLPLYEKHLHRFVDLDRLNLDGTLWAVGEKGRPLAVMEVFPFAAGDGPDRWSTAVASLTEAPLIAENVDGAAGQNWTPAGWGEAFHPFPDADAPAPTAEERQPQAAALAGRFTGHQFWLPGETRYELSVRPEPVLKYADDKSGILDGNLFILMHDTNPEVLLLIEAQAEKGKPQWKYALASMGSARMHVQFDDKEVWTRATPANVIGGGAHPYWVFGRLTPVEAK